LAVRDAQKAANCLARRSDLSALRAAILVLLAASHVDVAKMYAQKYVHECLLELDWSAAADVIAAEPSFQVRANYTPVAYVSYCCCVSTFKPLVMSLELTLQLWMPFALLE